MTDDPAAHTRAAAQAIAGNENPSEWLIAAAQRAVDHILSGLVRYEAAQPTRAEIRRRVEEVQKAAQIIVDQLFVPMNVVRRISDPKIFPLRDYLLNDGEHWLEHEVEMSRGLRSLIGSCSAKLREMPTQGGQGRPLPPMVAENTASGSTACALVVSFLWQEVRGRPPAVNDERAHEACLALWRAAGGGGVRLKTSGWRVDLQEARKERYEGALKTLVAVTGVHGIDPETP